MAENLEGAEQPHDVSHSSMTRIGLAARIVSAFFSISLALFICLWAYKLLIRDVSGIPVIAASDEPMRVAPENPGGKAAKNQGLSVNQVAEERSIIDFLR